MGGTDTDCAPRAANHAGAAHVAQHLQLAANITSLQTCSWNVAPANPIPIPGFCCLCQSHAVFITCAKEAAVRTQTMNHVARSCFQTTFSCAGSGKTIRTCQTSHSRECFAEGELDPQTSRVERPAYALLGALDCTISNR